MCLAIPVEIESIKDQVARCRVGEGETFLDASLMLMDGEVEVGDYLIVHAGFALRKLDPKEAEETLKILRDMIEITDGLAPEQCNF
ncbi:HypC/HybG/HupF family hydrogenase formation chaperone [Maridesulfovibrio hydrothermalis]|uniref:Hydrogenase expression/formation protein hypC n=1 Tax=Maridesulfovibrio hydrothermalis AM13 = DSM 14728 TaxID=1121451 RepID=L0RCV7_9BACT|nr:HypC/HybG/HupF family hydrogenase formation chaperone [Maridesulfovibrio hydrothermalis]CCO24618.1 Hydrogenase expression/formation protein hypC [Maridesulfovibrio hydrothermalis AM13 = DSM 14728]